MSRSLAPAFVMRRLVVALLLGACLALAAGGVALAQDDVQTLPDPNATPAPSDDGAGSGENGGSGGSQRGDGSPGNGGQGADALPETGLSALLLVTVGLTLIAAGIATRPIARRRRRYTSDTWVDIVRAGSSR